MSRPWVTRFSSRSARGRRRMGSGGRGVSICPATWRHCCQPVPDSQRDHLAHRPHGNDAAPPSSGGNWNVCYAATAGAAVCLPQRNSLPSTHMRCRITASLRATATRARAMPRSFGDVHAPGAQRRPFGAADQQRVGGFVECGTGQFVAASADTALYVGFARLIPPRRQAKMGADIARLSEAARLVDGGAERQRG